MCDNCGCVHVSKESVKMAVRKPKAIMNWEMGSGVFLEMDVECWLSGLRKELEECLTNGWSSHGQTHFLDYIKEEISPHYPLLGSFLINHTSNFYDSYVKSQSSKGKCEKQ